VAAVTVRKLNAAGVLVIEYAGEVVDHADGVLCLHARWERPTLDLGYVVFEPGDVFIEWFFGDRWYNIFEIHGTGAVDLKGWYCNVTTPASIFPSYVESRDLMLDVWVTPDGECLVLDEDEFAQCATLDSGSREAALKGLDDVRALVAQRAGPFSGLRDQLRNAGVRT
jgi:predicted RNA-binding protein associated with RNAse of E/G family